MKSAHRSRAWMLGPIAAVALIGLATAGAGAGTADPVPGSQGIDTTLPATKSQVTVKGRDQFSALTVTVNQTQNLLNQAVSITWTGGAPTLGGPGRFGGNYLTIMQCWGDDDGAVAGNPGPPPEQCVHGAYGGVGGSTAALFNQPNQVSRVIGATDWQSYDPKIGYLETRTGRAWRPFRSVGGTVVNVQFGPEKAGSPSVTWLNPFYNYVTTNEIPGAITGPNGNGAELFEVQTGLESSGLGCGQKAQPVGDGTKKVPQCWVVIVPRGLPADENVGTPVQDIADEAGVATSPLAPSAWKNRIAIPIGFNSVDPPCTLADVERRISRSELALPAVVSYQPLLCSDGKLPPFSFATVADGSARQQLLSNVAGGPGMVAISQPLAQSLVDPNSPVVYAPLSVSGVVIGFNIERNAQFSAPDAEKQLSGVRVAQLNLTPRLVAKLLTQSYRSQVEINGPVPAYTWLTNNADHLALDPDFLQFNPEFKYLLASTARTFAGLQLPSNNSDAARQVWQWILADAEARDWLAGTPDQFGMKVNPVYSTVAATNTSGIAFADPLPASFPKADPYCYKAEPLRYTTAPLLCGTDWLPYSRGFSDSARIARVANDSARIVLNESALASSDVWLRDAPQTLGFRNMMSLTDTPSAARFGIQMARLSRAGDNGADRRFVAPDSAGLTAGVASMAAINEPTVLEPAPSATAPGAYPLTSIVYGAIRPLMLSAQERSDYAAFLDYVAGPGQVSGPELGQLPSGFAVLPEAMRAQLTSAAKQVRTMTAPVTAPPATAPPTTVVDSSPVLPVGPTSPVTQSARPVVTTPRQTAPVVTVPVETVVESSVVDEPATSVVASSSTNVAPPATAAAVSPGPTPSVEPARSRFAIAGVGAVALGSALGALEITKRPRRRSNSPK